MKTDMIKTGTTASGSNGAVPKKVPLGVDE